MLQIKLYPECDTKIW